MINLIVNLKNDCYPIFITRNYEWLCHCLSKFNTNSRLIIISDTNVNYHQYKELSSVLKSYGYNIYKYIFEAGEKSKNLNTIENIYKFLLSIKADRNDMIIAFGGGVVGDVAGFVAATYLRGIALVQVPTSLLAQVDSSIGGKVGVNFSNVKNVVGAFYQPKLVYINTNTLKTLPVREIHCGLAEIIVHCIISDSNLFKYIEDKYMEIFQYNNDILEYIIGRNCEIKISVVEKDEKDTGLRAVLNFGHTIGHAIESVYNFELSHGECVSIGVVGAFRIAGYLGMVDSKVLFKIINLLKKVGLPYYLEGMDIEKVFNQMFFDKKILNNTLILILPEDIGRVVKYKCDDVQLIKRVLKELSMKPVL